MQQPSNRRGLFEKEVPLSSSLPNIPFGLAWESALAAEKQAPLIIGVAGGTASGKTSVCSLIISALKDHRVALVSQDSFYLPLTEEEKQNVQEYNFDHPESFDWELLTKTLETLRNPGRKGPKAVEIPVYDFVTHSRLDETKEIYGADIIILEGILVFYPKELRDLFDMKIFVDADADTRLARRVIRDINHRGRDVMGVLRQYEKFVKPSFDEYINPTKKYADVIVPRGADNVVAINLLVEHIKANLARRTVQTNAVKRAI
eukprot:TRINITY_DN2295_c0_g1_i1.p1 TRINITY_DN2295_c0_g1~~TRINITY_DN2295_c0_g1_i1.p1  ORF type:complete len:261 (+),score=53.25 TRINITY_DN2295_c0_g1_i1:209-991(+)